jgi:hypothetical protein
MEDVRDNSAQNKNAPLHLAFQCGNLECLHWIRVRTWEFSTAPNFDPDLIVRLECDRCGAEHGPRARFLRVIDEQGRIVELPSEQSEKAS